MTVRGEAAVNETARRLGSLATTASRRCGACLHFNDDPHYFETVIAGLTSMGSAHASVRGRDGICLLRDRFCSATWSCAEFTVKALSQSDAAEPATAKIA
jgi:hypothetical protein